MKLKTRFKKALFSFFKDEILESLGHNSVTEYRFVCEQMDIIKYEKALDKAKKDLFEQVVNHIVVDTESILDRRQIPLCERYIKLNLFVGIKK